MSKQSPNKLKEKKKEEEKEDDIFPYEYNCYKCGIRNEDGETFGLCEIWPMCDISYQGAIGYHPRTECIPSECVFFFAARGGHRKCEYFRDYGVL